jgi:hypothetical protein
MSKQLQQYCATDKEIHDLYKSGKRRITESVLLELAKDRGIFFSPSATRDELIDKLSALTHDYYDVAGVIDKRTPQTKREKTTSVSLEIQLNTEELKSAVAKYQKKVVSTEKVTSLKRGANKLVMQLDYNEYDYSRTRLIQRQPKEATLEFVTEGDVTTVRMPANAKARSVLEDIRKSLEEIKKTAIEAQQIELSELTESEDRTMFFMGLIESIPDYTLQTVTNIKVTSDHSNENEEFDSEDADEPASQEMLAVVHSVALNGENLVASPEYQQLRAGGFYITAITWRSKCDNIPFDLVQFEASFENPEEGTGFRYNVRVANKKADGEYVKNFKTADEDDRTKLFALIESSARNNLDKLIEARKEKLATSGGTTDSTELNEALIEEA